MTNTALNRDPEESVLKPCTLDEISEYIVDATGASVTADSSVRLIHKYCDTLPRDKYVFFLISVIIIQFTALFVLLLIVLRSLDKGTLFQGQLFNFHISEILMNVRLHCLQMRLSKPWLVLHAKTLLYQSRLYA